MWRARSNVKRFGSSSVEFRFHFSRQNSSFARALSHFKFLSIRNTRDQRRVLTYRFVSLGFFTEEHLKVWNAVLDISVRSNDGALLLFQIAIMDVDDGSMASLTWRKLNFSCDLSDITMVLSAQRQIFVEIDRLYSRLSFFVFFVFFVLFFWTEEIPSPVGSWI